MPCDIGFKAYVKAEIPVPQPQTFTVKSEAPAIDADLLEKLGIEDPEFLAWMSELAVRPLLEEALKRALKASPRGGIDFSVDDQGMLEARGRFTTSAEKQNQKRAAAAVSDRWQFEILGIVAEILGYAVTINVRGEEMTLEAEEAGKSHPCDYIRVSRRGADAEVTFEHFKSRKALDLATARFFALADRLGVEIRSKGRSVEEGDPFPNQVGHSHSHPHAHGHAHGRAHDHDDDHRH